MGRSKLRGYFSCYFTNHDFFQEKGGMSRLLKSVQYDDFSVKYRKQPRLEVFLFK